MIQQQLNKLLDSYAVLIQALQDVLAREQRALGDRNFKSIEKTTLEKESLLKKLQALEHQRLNLEQDSDLIGKKAMREAFRNRLGPVVKHCSETNRANGSIVEISRQFNQRLLQALRGTNSADEPLYDAHGGARDNRSQQVFAKI